jgi:hypothetical protein
MERNNFNATFGDTNNNFDPSMLQTSDIIQLGIAIDKSYSIIDYVDELNAAKRGTIERMKNSHHSPKILYSEIAFSSDIETVHGYHPIANVQAQDISPDNTTPLFAATLQLINDAIDYRDSVEANWGEARTMLFILTDGKDNTSQSQFGVSAGDVKNRLNEYFRENEGAIATFEIFLLGIGKINYDYFKQAAADMGVKLIAQDPNDNRPIEEVVRSYMTVVSESASSGSTANVQNLVI